MKIMPISQFRRALYSVLREEEMVLITKWGKPKALWVPFHRLPQKTQREALAALEKNRRTR